MTKKTFNFPHFFVFIAEIARCLTFAKWNYHIKWQLNTQTRHSHHSILTDFVRDFIIFVVEYVELLVAVWIYQVQSVIYCFHAPLLIFYCLCTVHVTFSFVYKSLQINTILWVLKSEIYMLIMLKYEYYQIFLVMAIRCCCCWSCYLSLQHSNNMIGVYVPFVIVISYHFILDFIFRCFVFWSLLPFC